MKKILYLFLLITAQLSAYNVGLLVVATGKYIQFIPPLLASARKHFCTNQNVTFFVFTDGQLEQKEDDVVVLQHKRYGWPKDTLFRFLAYLNHQEAMAGMDYLFACDADMLFVGDIGDEILSERVASQSPGYIGKRGTYEERPFSTAYVAPHEGSHYFAGGFYGGTYHEFFSMMREVMNNIEQDLRRGIIAIWHDESHLNRYFINHEPTLILPREYCARPFDQPQKLVALDKNHAEFRG